jgi:hypothetical protein
MGKAIIGIDNTRRHFFGVLYEHLKAMNEAMPGAVALLTPYRHA